MVAFSNLKSLSTRLVNALQATDASDETIDDAKGFNRKMQGKKASSTQTPTTTNAPLDSSLPHLDFLLHHLELCHTQLDILFPHLDFCQQHLDFCQQHLDI